MIKSSFPARLAIAPALLGMSLGVWAQQKPADNDIHILKVQGNVYMFVGPAGNSTVQVGPNGVLVVDSQTADMSAKLIAAIKTLSDKPIRYIINTSFDADRTGGNESPGPATARRWSAAIWAIAIAGRPSSPENKCSTA